MNGSLATQRLLVLCLIVLLGGIPFAHAQDSLNMQLEFGEESVGSFHSAKIHSSGNIYVTARRTGILVYQPDGDAFALLHQVDLPERYYRNMELHGDTLMAAGLDSIYFFEIEDDASLSHLATLSTWLDDPWVDVAYYIQWEGGPTLYMAGSSYLFIYDISDLQNPQLLWEAELIDFMSGSIRDISVSGEKLAYTLEDWDNDEYTHYNYLLDISDPENPQAVAQPEDFPFSGYDASLEGDRMVVAEDGEVAVMDVSDPDNILLEGYLPHEPDESHQSPRIHDGYIYAVEPDLEETRLFAHDDVEGWRQTDVLDPTYTIISVHSFDNTTVGASWNRGMLTWTFDDNDGFADIISFDPVETWSRITQVGDAVLFENHPEAVKVYGVNDADEFVMRGRLSPPVVTASQILAQGDNRAVISAPEYQDFLITSHTQFLVLPDDEEPLGIRISNGFITEGRYCASGFSDYLYFFDKSGTGSALEVIDATDPDNPDGIASQPMDSVYIRAMQVYDSTMYMLVDYPDNHLTNLRVYSLDNPEQPEQVNEIPLNDIFSGMRLFENQLFIFGYGNDVTVYWVLNPRDPAFMQTLDLDFDTRSLDSWNGYLLATLYNRDSGHVRYAVFDYSNYSATPPLLAWYEKDVLAFGRSARFLSDGRVVTNWGLGYGVFEWEDTGVDDTPAPARPGEPVLSAYPNPANPEARISLTLPQAGEVAVQVFDVLGRSVATLHEGALRAGQHNFRFGAQPGLAGGVYFVKVQTEHHTRIQKVVLLK